MAQRRVLVISTIVVAIAGVGAWYELQRAEPDGVAAAAPVPVTVAIASRQDLPIYLSGLGVVQASFTVGIRAQVVGMLEQVLFKEGDHVRTTCWPRLIRGSQKGAGRSPTDFRAEGPPAVPHPGRQVL